MKTRKTFFLCAVISLLGEALMAISLFEANSFEKACHKGAYARVVFRVMNDVGSPVVGVNVNVLFDMADRGEGRRVIGTTDTNGVCVVEGKTVGVLKIEVSREGYYRTNDELCFITMGHSCCVRCSRKHCQSQLFQGAWAFAVRGLVRKMGDTHS